MQTIKRITLSIIALLFAILSIGSAFAHHYTYQEPSHGYPIYESGYYYEPYVYGYSGWDYHRVYYQYHYPYSNYRYNSYYPPGTWVAHYGIWSSPRYVAYPWPGYYW